jgi:hypothetical protein
VTPPAGLGFVAGNGLGAGYRRRPDRRLGGVPSGGYAAQRDRQSGQPLPLPAQPAAHRLRVHRSGSCRTRSPTTLGRDDWQTEQSELLFGSNFGIVTDIQTGPDGALYLVGTSSGTVRKIWKP